MLVIIIALKSRSCSKMNIVWCIFVSKNKFSAIVSYPMQPVISSVIKQGKWLIFLFLFVSHRALLETGIASRI